MFHQDIKSPGPLEPKNQARLYLCWGKSVFGAKKGSNFKYPEVFQCDNWGKFKGEWQNCLKNTMVTFEERQQKTSILIQPFWKLLIRSWQNCYLNRWMPKSFGTLKKY